MGGDMNNLQKVVTNVYTKKQIVLANASNVEKEVFDNSILITETDLQGIIVYVNRRYCGLTGFIEDELIGFPHSIVRHPDIPRGVFKAIWKIISSGKIWRGYLKHLCKDGSFFWTLSYIQPKFNNYGQITGYTSSSKVAYLTYRIEAEEQYKRLKDDKYIDDPYFMQSEDYQEYCLKVKEDFNE